MMTDPIADMITRIRNAGRARHARTEVPSSKLKLAIVKVLEHEGFVSDVRVEAKDGHPQLNVGIRYRPDGSPLIDGIRRVSKPGRRVYVAGDAVPRVRNGLGVGIISTSKGVLSDSSAREQSIGGEFMCEVW